MSARLQQLQQQRKLLQAQLARLDEQINAEIEARIEPAATVSSPPAPTAPSSPAVSPEEIMARYQTDPASVQSDVKRGCFLYFFLAFAVVGLGVLGLYFYSRAK